VFQHDAGQGLFQRTVRAYSHGCMRVQIRPNTPRFSSTSPARASIGRRRRSEDGGSERDLQLQHASIWVHLTYQTAFVDNSGKLEMRRDIYGLDGRTIAAIRASAATWSRRPSASARRSPPPAQADGPGRPDQRAPAVDLHHAGLRQAAAAVDLPLSVSVPNQQ
jgi:hypothetical protein